MIKKIKSSALSFVKRMVPRSVKHHIKLMAQQDLDGDTGAKEYFSQFGEDACIQNYFASKSWRNNNKYGDYSAIDKGFFVDVGAHDPVHISNTYWFYKRGWRGINIDVLPHIKESFDEERPRDINIQAAILNEERDLIFYTWRNDPAFNTLSAEKAKELVASIGEPEELYVTTIRLEDLLDKHLPKGKPISFFSIDAEGCDLEVLKSNNWDKYRPDLVIAENDDSSLDAVADSSITSFMRSVGYDVYAWVPASVIYKNKDV